MAHIYAHIYMCEVNRSVYTHMYEDMAHIYAHIHMCEVYRSIYIHICT